MIVNQSNSADGISHPEDELIDLKNEISHLKDEINQLKNQINHANDETSYIISSNTSYLKRLVTYTFTLIMWVYVGNIVLFWVSSLLNYNPINIRIIRSTFNMNGEDIISSLVEILAALTIMIIILIVWKTYKKSQYRNRTHNSSKIDYPTPTTKEEILNLGLIDNDIYEVIQRSHFIVFENDPIKSIYASGDMTTHNINNKKIRSRELRKGCLKKYLGDGALVLGIMSIYFIRNYLMPTNTYKLRGTMNILVEMLIVLILTILMLALWEFYNKPRHKNKL